MNRVLPLAVKVPFTKVTPTPDAPVFRLTTESGVTGNPVTSWAAEIGNVTLTASDTPTVVTGPGTNNYIETNGSDFLESAASIGDLPSGNSPVTMIGAMSFGAGQWGGFGWGSGNNAEAFSVIRDGFSEEITVDWFNEQIQDGYPLPNDVEVLFCATHDGGGNYTLQIGNWIVASISSTPTNIATERVNVMRTFSGLPQAGRIGFIEVYDKVLTTSQITERMAELEPGWINRPTAPTASNVTTTAASSMSVDFGATLDQGQSRLHGVISENEPTEGQILAGQDANGNFSPAVQWESLSDGDSFTSSGSGLTPSTTYRLWYFTETAYGVKGAITSGPAATLPDNDTTPTSITPTSVSFYASQPVDETIANFNADQPDCVFSKTGGDAALAVSPTGALSITSTMTTGSKALTVQADNTANGGGTYAQAIGVTVNESPSYGDADYTVNNWDDLISLLNSWSGTVPDGRDVIVEIDGPSSGTKRFSGDLNHQVTIRPTPGNFTMDSDANGNITGGNGCKLTGCFDIRGSSNLRLFRLHIETDGSGPYGDGTPAVFDGDTTNTLIENCWLTCTPYPHDLSQYTSIGPNWPISPGRAGSLTRNLTYRNCLITYADTSMVDITSRVDNLTLEGNVMDWIRNDCVKAQNYSVTNDCHLLNNWWPMHAAIRNGAHVDNVQFQGGEHYRRIARGNVMMVRKFGPNSYEDLGQQCYFDQVEQSGPTAVVDWLYEQNMCCGNIQTGIRVASYNPSSPTSGIIIRNNDFAIGEVGDRGDPQQTDGYPGGLQNPHIWGSLGSGYVIENNIQLDPVGRISEPAYIGATDIQHFTGDKNSTPDFNDYVAYNPGSPGYSGLYSARPTSNNFDISWMMPPEGSQAHWDHPNPKGCAIRKQEITNGQHPGNEGWPVSTIWQNNFNKAGNIVSLASSSFNAVGDNA